LMIVIIFMVISFIVGWFECQALNVVPCTSYNGELLWCIRLVKW
jgi:hypothetical protein